MDLAARPGLQVRAVAPGRVSFAGTVAGRGVLSVKLSGTGRPPLRTTYEPVRPSVRKGERVKAGQTVATLAPGPAHCPAGCLHWGLLRGERYLNPLSLLPPGLLRGGPSRLLPVFGVPLPRGAPAASIGGLTPVRAEVAAGSQSGTPGDEEPGNRAPSRGAPGKETDHHWAGTVGATLMLGAAALCARPRLRLRR